MNRIYKNIRKEYLFQLVRNTSLSEAVWMLFLAARGMSLIQIGLLESIFHITGMLMEVPTGFIADRYGRKVSRVMARGLALISSLVMLSSNSFWGFALGFVFSALSFNLESGAGEALIYDSLVQCKREEEYMKIRGRNEICYQLSHVLSLVVGGAVAGISYNLVYGITAVIHACALIISLSFEEPQVTKLNKETALIQHMGQSLKAVWKNRSILPFMLHMEVFSLFYTTLHFYFQNFMKEGGYREYQIGLMFAVSAVLGAIIAALAYKIEKRLGEKKMVLLTGIAPGLLFSAIAFTRAEIVALILLAGIEGLVFVIFGDYIHRRIPSEHRATLLSFQAMFFSILMIVFFPIIGGLSQYFSFKTAFALIAVISLVSGVMTTLFLLKSMKKEVLKPSGNEENIIDEGHPSVEEKEGQQDPCDMKI